MDHATDDPSAAAALDLDRVERELADVEVALARLEDGTYWTCELSGAPLPEELLEHDPIARRLPAASLPPADPGS